MFSKLKNLYQNNLKYVGNEKLSKLSIVFIIVLNIFVFTVINYGLDFQTKIVNNPNASYPYNCREVFRYPSKIHNYDDYMYTRTNNNLKYNEIRKKEFHTICSQYFEKLEIVQKNIDFNDIIKYKDQKNKELSSVNTELDYIQSNYNTILFEKIANQNSEKSIVKGKLEASNIKAKYQKLKTLKNSILEEIKKKKQWFKSHKDVLALYNFVKSNPSVLDEYKKEKKDYYLFTKLIEIMFLVPLLFVFYYLSRKSLLRQKYIPHIIMKNLLVVTLIPFLISTFSLVYSYLPHLFIGKLIDFFYSIKIPFVVYYLLMAIAIVIIYFVIVKIQKNEKLKRESLKNNKLSAQMSFNRGICNSCENKVDYMSMNFCPHCSEKLKVKCEKCEKLTFKALSYCFHCGC